MRAVRPQTGFFFFDHQGLSDTESSGDNAGVVPAVDLDFATGGLTLAAGDPTVGTVG